MAYLNSKNPGQWQSRNNSVGGWYMSDALKAAEYRLTDRESDLMVLAFGMNDSRTTKAKKYEKKLKDVVKAIRSEYPKTSILLVSSTLANPQSPLQKPELLDSYQKILREFAEEHDDVMLVDATSTWRKLLEHKSFYDITGNGFNHPNDFGHRVLAESVISALVGPAF